MAVSKDPAFGRAIKGIREKHGWKQSEIISRITTYYSDERSYRRIENADRLPARDAALAILMSGLEITGLEQLNQLLALAGHAGLDAEEQVHWGVSLAAPASGLPTVPLEESRLRAPEQRSRSSHRMTRLSAICLLALSGWLCASAPPHAWFAGFTALLYAALYVASLFLETTYAERPSSRKPFCFLIFALMVLSCAAAYAADAWCARSGNEYGLLVSLSLSALAAALQFALARPALPNSAIPSDSQPILPRPHT